MKRDDLTGLASGGNKVRKLEHLIQDALSKKADVVLTPGAQQSNHCRQTAAACAITGLECHLLLGGTEPEIANGNLLLNKFLGANIHFTGPERKGESLLRIATELKDAGRRPYIIPLGGSNAIGARGFVDAVGEVKVQLENLSLSFDRIIFASSSGGTQAGLMVGTRIHNLRSQILGIAIDKGGIGNRPFRDHIADIIGEMKSFHPVAGEISVDSIELNNDYVGSGYGVVSDAEREAISLVASTEGVLLDPVYTGRAMAGVIDMIRKGDIKGNEKILFWHTGGTPALFAYAADL